MQEQDIENATQDDAFVKRVERLRQLHPSDVAEEIEGLVLDEIRDSSKSRPRGNRRHHS